MQQAYKPLVWGTIFLLKYNRIYFNDNNNNIKYLILSKDDISNYISNDDISNDISDDVREVCRES